MADARGAGAGDPVRRTRTSCRVVLIDRHERVLLIRVVHGGRLDIPGVTSPPTYWITPGGGTEGDETFAQTARRELFEETGIERFDLGPFLLEAVREITLDGEPMIGVQRYYAGFVDEATPGFDHLDPLELGVIVEHRWWTLEEITDPLRTETIFPDGIAALAADAIAARP